MKNLSIPPKISLPVGIVLIIIGLIARSILDIDIEVANLYGLLLVWSIILLGFILAVIGFTGLRTLLIPMAIRKTAIIILISAAIIWATVLLVFGFFVFLLSLGGLIITAIWLAAIIWAGLTSLRALAWAFILMGVFFLFFFPLTAFFPHGIGTSFIYFVLISVGINFTFGLLSAIISLFQRKKVLTTEEKKKHN